ncbi:DUF418 domain-containing protein [Noviherbaspirillum sp. L7-7A]|uniref:DUF418 domain-containing protein n=1 Tax=Noviherbaspirillum sp. L7-7A TaxID=2850560 RepID=UPI0020112DE3|nr:DUF418 domain-containing protein [Noviherbaspirillum sp. L7-7A]
MPVPTEMFRAGGADAAASPRRIAHIDVLRGMAVFGILLVNVWSFVWGFGALRYGAIAEPSWLDRGVVFAVALLAEQKFYPIFAFLFGAGFALQARSLRRRLRDQGQVHAALRYRFRWLLGCGVLHGLLLWAGDILTVYGAAGFLLLRLFDARLRRVRASLRNWCLIWLAVLAASVALSVPSIDQDADDARQEQAIAYIEDAQEARAIYAEGTAGDIAAQRLPDYLAVTSGSLLLVPHLMVLFLLGICSVRMGWLTAPQRHALLWRRVRNAGLLIGLPLNLAWAAAAATGAANPLAAPAWGELAYALLPLGGSLLAAAYVAALLLARGALMRRASAWLAPVGRMSLTNYLMQSLLGVCLLQGTALGSQASPAGLMLFALAIMMLQALASRWWLSRHAQGPMERLAARGRPRA